MRPAARLLTTVCIGCSVAALAAATCVAVRGASQAANAGGQPDSTIVPEVLLSRQLVADNNLHVGDVVTLAADPRGARATRFRVAGVYEPTPDPKQFTLKRLEARLHLPDLIALTADPDDPLADESVDAINLALTDPQGRRPGGRPDFRRGSPA